MKNFEKIIGYQDVKVELARTCDIMLYGDKYQKLGVSTPRGLLLHGEPGVGKTLMATSLIAASGRAHFTCRKDRPNGSFVNQIRETFEKAKANAPSIVFLDDMDKFANEDDRHRNAEEYVTIQSCIDECKDFEVFVLATANDLSNLPDSLHRVGRFDKVIRVRNPEAKDAEEIISYYLSKKNYVGDIDAREIARILSGRSCAELETVVNEAGVYAGFENKEKIEMDDMIRACMRVIFKAPERVLLGNIPALEETAYHEAGHTVVAELLEEGSVSLVSVYPHGKDIGGVTSYYQDDKYFHYKRYMVNRVMALLAGKAATEIVYGEVDVGANSDLHRAFDIVMRFVDDYCSTSFDRWNHRESSKSTLERRDMQIYVEMERYYAEARRMLIQNRAFLDKVAAALVEKKTLLSKDIQAIRKECKFVA